MCGTDGAVGASEACHGARRPAIGVAQPGPAHQAAAIVNPKQGNWQVCGGDVRKPRQNVRHSPQSTR